MKLHELFENRLLLESVTLPKVTSLNDLKDPSTKKYYTGEVNVTSDVILIGKKLKQLPAKFGRVDGNFSCLSNELISLEGAPSYVGGNFNCAMNKLTSLEGIPSVIGGSFSLDFCGITSLQGIHKIIKKMNGYIFLPMTIESGGIGLILIEGLSKIVTNHAEKEAFKIISRYLGQGKKGLLLCQDELIDAGLEEYAKL